MNADVACSEIVGRALKLDHINLTEDENDLCVSSVAFFLRVEKIEPGGDAPQGWHLYPERSRRIEKGLSVSRKDLEQFSVTLAKLSKSVAIGSLHTGRIRDLSKQESRFQLDVVADPLPNDEAHAEIRGLPEPAKFTGEHNFAVTVAVELSESARIALHNGTKEELVNLVKAK